MFKVVIKIERVVTFNNSSRKKSRHAKSSGGNFGIGEDTEALIKVSSDGIALINGRGIIKLLNQSASDLTGWAVADATDLDFRTVFQFFDATERTIPEDKNPITLAISANVKAELKSIFLKTASSKYTQVTVHAIPLQSALTGKKASFFDFLSKPISKDDPNLPKVFNGTSVAVVFRDISSQQKENHEQADFISTASHEMRTPVAVIEGYISMIMNPITATVDERARGYAQKAHDAAQHLGHLFQALLDITKIDDNRMTTNPILVDARVAAKQVVGRLNAKAVAKGLELSYVASTKVSPLYIIYVDLDQLEEILDNLVDNAIKYTPKGSVKLSVTDNNNRVRISVTDTGMGIPSEDVSHLFQKFYRVDSSDTREIGGTGLGLYLIKRLTEEMGGQVGVESNYGQGSTFWVEFELLTHNQAVARAKEIRARKAKR